jgi:hypothetical protein
MYLGVGHVAPMYILLHYNYLEIEKIKKGQLKFEHDSRKQSCRKLPKTFYLECDSKIPYEINDC